MLMFYVFLMMACCLTAKPEVTVSTESITAGELIPFTASDPRSMIPLGFAPNPGLARRFSKEELLAKISEAGFSTEDLQLPETILVRRISQLLDRDQATRAIRDAFVRQFPSANIQINSLEIPAVQVGAGSIDVLASLPPNSNPSGPLFVKLDVRGNDFIRTLYVRVQARVEIPQPVIVRTVSAQSRIQPEDVEWRPAVLAGTPDILESLDSVRGMVAKRDLVPGTVLSKELLYMPVYVQRGDAVTVRATAGGVTVSATMRAKDSGKFGDSIVVEHISGAGTTTARIVGPRTLEAIQGAQ
jgi:flagella basal body P-ring formation protein FlgA